MLSTDTFFNSSQVDVPTETSNNYSVDPSEHSDFHGAKTTFLKMCSDAPLAELQRAYSAFRPYFNPVNQQVLLTCLIRGDLEVINWIMKKNIQPNFTGYFILNKFIQNKFRSVDFLREVIKVFRLSDLGESSHHIPNLLLSSLKLREVDFVKCQLIVDHFPSLVKITMDRYTFWFSLRALQCFLNHTAPSPKLLKNAIQRKSIASTSVVISHSPPTCFLELDEKDWENLFAQQLDKQAISRVKLSTDDDLIKQVSGMALTGACLFGYSNRLEYLFSEFPGTTIPDELLNNTFLKMVSNLPTNQLVEWLLEHYSIDLHMEKDEVYVRIVGSHYRPIKNLISFDYYPKKENLISLLHRILEVPASIMNCSASFIDPSVVMDDLGLGQYVSDNYNDLLKRYHANVHVIEWLVDSVQPNCEVNWLPIYPDAIESIWESNIVKIILSKYPETIFTRSFPLNTACDYMQRVVHVATAQSGNPIVFDGESAATFKYIPDWEINEDWNYYFQGPDSPELLPKLMEHRRFAKSAKK